MKLNKVIKNLVLSAMLLVPAALQAAPVYAAETKEAAGASVTETIRETVGLTAKKLEKSVNQKEAGRKIAEAAKAQIGVSQDCTMLVTNSLKAVGINFHGAPAQYAVLGEWTNDPKPGDIIIYSGHVAIYIGEGRAIHGGWLGYTTIESTVECTNALIGYIRVKV